MRVVGPADETEASSECAVAAAARGTSLEARRPEASSAMLDDDNHEDEDGDEYDNDDADNEE